jgi:hypothetical protein
MLSRHLIVCLIITAALLRAQDPPAPPAEAGQAPAAPAPGAMRPAATEAEPRPYDRVITKEAKTQKGLFTVHQIKSRYYFEIPKSELGKDILLVSQLQKTTSGAGYGGNPLGNRVLRWERSGNRVLLKTVSYSVVADPNSPISAAVRNAHNPTIVMAFNIEALSKDDAAVIDVSRLFTTEVTELSARRALNARGFDSARSFIDAVRVFPENVNVTAIQTYTSPDTGASPFGGGAPSNPFQGGMRPGTNATVTVSYSMVKLPEHPMMPRLMDERVGYFHVTQLDYSVDEFRAPERTYITKWRLEKKEPGAAVSEPVKPITFYLDPATPQKWRKWIRMGVEDWRPAFEQAGFRNAIVCLDPPENDPTWSPEDARISSIRWLPSTVKNAMGPHVHDPRTGEILESDIMIYHNILELNQDWYFAQVGPLDPRAQKLPMAEEVAGEMLRYVVAHEVGHTLGLPHNFKASALYSLAQVRDKKWVKENGHTPTLMDYSRLNYVAQPEDGIDPKDLIPKIGPYDKFAILWAYKPVPGAKSPDEEKPALAEILKAQETKPWLRFSTFRSLDADPGEQTEAVGDADAVEATRLGTKNIQRVMDLLLTAVPRNGETYEELGRMYQVAMGQWQRELGHVARVVGGFDSTPKVVGQPGAVFTPVSRERQLAALKFLQDNAFSTPKWAVRPDILRRVEPVGEMDRLLAVQRSVLTQLMNPLRLARLQEAEAVDGAASYTLPEFLSDLQRGLFSELAQPAPKVDPWRRNLQRAYLELVNERLNGRPSGTQTVMNAGMGVVQVTATAGDARGLLRAELRGLLAQVSSKAAADKSTKAHLEDVKDQIAKILDPKLAPQAAAPAISFGRPSFDEGCWPALDAVLRSFLPAYSEEPE